MEPLIIIYKKIEKVLCITLLKSVCYLSVCLPQAFLTEIVIPIDAQFRQVYIVELQGESYMQKGTATFFHQKESFGVSNERSRLGLFKDGLNSDI